MKIIAEKFNCNYYHNRGIFLHMFTSKNIDNFTLSRLSEKTISRKIKNKLIFYSEKIYNAFFKEKKDIHHIQSLTERDTNLITEKLKQKI